MTENCSGNVLYIASLKTDIGSITSILCEDFLIAAHGIFLKAIIDPRGQARSYNITRKGDRAWNVLSNAKSICRPGLAFCTRSQDETSPVWILAKITFTWRLTIKYAPHSVWRQHGKEEHRFEEIDANTKDIRSRVLPLKRGPKTQAQKEEITTSG